MNKTFCDVCNKDITVEKTFELFLRSSVVCEAFETKDIIKDMCVNCKKSIIRTIKAHVDAIKSNN